MSQEQTNIEQLQVDTDNFVSAYTLHIEKLRELKQNLLRQISEINHELNIIEAGQHPLPVNKHPVAQEIKNANIEDVITTEEG